MAFHGVDPICIPPCTQGYGVDMCHRFSLGLEDWLPTCKSIDLVGQLIVIALFAMFGSTDM